MPASRALRFLALVLAASLASPALAASPALVIDADSGKVLHAERATDPWFPASITKLMTAYVALQMVREGTAAMDQLLTISPEAAAQPPSKMGFRPGTELRLDNALKIIMVKSANDISAAIAENLGGSVEGFAAHMNEASQRLGMHSSHWVNPHGLPDDRQRTSARDMALLGRALLREFPEHRDLFQIGAIQFGRRVMRNHNGLIGRYAGVDGMKTGFICASGFNVVASATRGNRRLITVVMGSPSANERTLRAAELFDRGFETLGWGGQSVENLPPSASLTPPNLRPVICERRGPVGEDDGQGTSLLQANADGNADNPTAGLFGPPTGALAFAGSGGSVAPAGPRLLPPRAPVQPVVVWLGPGPGPSLAAKPLGGETPALQDAPARARIAARPAARAKVRPSREPEVTLKAPAPIIAGAEASGNKGAISPSAALKPAGAERPKAGAVSAGAAQRPKAGAIAAKPKVAAAAEPDAEPRASKPRAPASAASPAKAKVAASTSEAKKPVAKKAAAKKPAESKADD